MKTLAKTFLLALALLAGAPDAPEAEASHVALRARAAAVHRGNAAAIRRAPRRAPKFAPRRLLRRRAVRRPNAVQRHALGR